MSTLKNKFAPFDDALAGAYERNLLAALMEDIGTGDLTGKLVPEEGRATARVIVREEAVLCGAPWFEGVMEALDPSIGIDWHYAEGDLMAADTPVCTIVGPARAILTAERSALNFMQLMSGVATATRRYVDVIAGTTAAILDTRKTIPGMRLAQKYAVRCGGGVNHRMGLYDAVMLKENHIRAAGSLVAAIRHARARHAGLPLIVEVETLQQLREALGEGCDRILIDDFDAAARREAVRIARAAPFDGRIPLEVSGGVDLDGLRAIAEDGVDCISIGGLTKHVRAIDLSLKLGPPPA